MNTKANRLKTFKKMNYEKLEKKVLFLYASLNSGHQKAAQAVREFLLMQAPDIETMDIEALRFSYPNLGKLVHIIYMTMATNLSGFYDFLWDNVSIEKRIGRLKEIINEKSLDKFAELFISFPARVAVCTQALPCGFLSTLKKERGFSFALIAIITDYDVHAYWIYDNVDVYCVATSAMKEKLMQRNVPEKKIKIMGIPVRSQFIQKTDSQIVKNKLSINNELPCILIMGGSYGVGPLTKIIMGLSKIEKNFNMLVVAGKNEKLYKNLQRKTGKIKKPVFLFNYTDTLSSLMQVSDVLITKPGGLTISEALCFGLPMIITRGVRGQESGNFRYLVEAGAAVGVEEPKDVALKFEELIDDEVQLKVMRENALKIAKPKAASQISRLIKGFL